MGCCGQRRAALAGPSHRVRVARTPPVPTAPDDQGPATLTYRGPVPMVLLGPVTRQAYRMVIADDVVAVDPSDVGPLLRSGWFVARAVDR